MDTIEGSSELICSSSVGSQGSDDVFKYDSSTSSDESYDDILDAPNYSIDKEMSVRSEVATRGFIVGIDDNWVCHVGSRANSPRVTVKRFNLETKKGSKHSLELDMGSEDWTLAKTIGRDGNLLLASGHSVIRVGFLQDGTYFKDITEVAFSINAISWDEFGVDCYLLTNNRRDVYWYLMHGKVNHLCTFKESIESAISMTASNRCTVILLDTHSSRFYTANYEKPSTRYSTELPLQLPANESIGRNMDRLAPCAIASTSTAEYHFVLFTANSGVVVGLYDRNFDFLRCVVVEQMSESSTSVDIAVQGANLVLLLGARVLMYKIPLKLT